MSEYQQVLVQKYFEGCNLDWMVGTKECPFYIIGELETKGKNWATITYPKEVGNHFPGFITPRVTGSELCNLIIGDTYLVGVCIVESLGEVDGLIFRYRLEWGEPIEEVIMELDDADNNLEAVD